MPITVNHKKPSFLRNNPNFSPNFIEKYETIKNLNPLEIRLITINIYKLKPIKPLVIVKTL